MGAAGSTATCSACALHLAADLNSDGAPQLLRTKPAGEKLLVTHWFSQRHAASHAGCLCAGCRNQQTLLQGMG